MHTELTGTDHVIHTTSHGLRKVFLVSIKSPTVPHNSCVFISTKM